MPEARVKQMQYRVFGSADVKIDTAGLLAIHPVTFRFLTDETFVILRIAKP